MVTKTIYKTNKLRPFSKSFVEAPNPEMCHVIRTCRVGGKLTLATAYIFNKNSKRYNTFPKNTQRQDAKLTLIGCFLFVLETFLLEKLTLATT